MTAANTETRNGWGPAAPTRAEEADISEPKTEAPEEIGGEENGEEEVSRRRIYTGGEDNARGGDEGSEDEGDAEDEAGEYEDGSSGEPYDEEEEPEDLEPEGQDSDEDGIEEFGPPRVQREPNEPEPAVASQDSGEEPEDNEDDEDSVPPLEPTHPVEPEQDDPELAEPETFEEVPDNDHEQHTGAAVGSTSTGKKNSRRNSRQRRQQPSEGTAREQVPREQAAKEQAAKEQAAKEQAAKEQAPQERVSAPGAFDPDAATKAPQQSPEPQSPSRREQASYGSYGAGKFRRVVGSSLGRLSAIGKLFSSGGGAGADARSTTSGSKQRGEADLVSVAEDQSVADQGIAAKPSPQEIERRLALALRETYIDGYSKIAVGSPKGGVGKSSLAYGMGCAIANNTNIRVCLVDADPEFGATRSLVPRPVPYSIVDLARDADNIHRLSDIRSYVAQNERMRLDVLLNPQEMIQKAQVGDLPAAYERIDEALSRFYDLVIYDMGIGFSHPQIQKILSLSDELLLVGDSEVVPNDIFADALSYIQGLGFGLDNATLAISHRLPPTDESATTGLIKSEHARKLRRVTEIPYDAAMSQLLNRRAFHIDALSLDTRLGILTTAAASLEGLRGTDKDAPDSRKRG